MAADRVSDRRCIRAGVQVIGATRHAFLGCVICAPCGCDMLLHFTAAMLGNRIASAIQVTRTGSF